MQAVIFPQLCELDPSSRTFIWCRDQESWVSLPQLICFCGQPSNHMHMHTIKHTKTHIHNTGQMIHQITEREAGQCVCLSSGSETEINGHFITAVPNSQPSIHFAQLHTNTHRNKSFPHSNSQISGGAINHQYCIFHSIRALRVLIAKQNFFPMGKVCA